MPQHIQITNYNPTWPEKFEEEAAAIREILGDACLAVYHIGSTAVPGLAAKPIIDIMPVVTTLSRADALASRFEEAGYEYLGEFGIPGRRYLRKGGDERTHQLHIFAKESRREIARHLAVRDYLRSHPDEAAVYGQLKQELAARYPWDIDGYCDGKDAFVKALEERALCWRQESGMEQGTGRKAW